MALIQYAAPWDRQPQEAVGVDWNNPLTNGLIFSSSLASGGGFRDEVGGLRPTINGTVAQGPTGDGTGAVFSGSDYLDFGASQIIPLGTPFTLTFYEEVTATSSYAAMLGLVAGSRQFLWIRGTSSYVCVLGVADGTTVVKFASMPAQFVGERIRFVLTGDAIDSNSGLRLWANGVEQTQTGGSFGATSASSNKLGWDGADEKFQGRISDLHMLARRWSTEEVESFFDAPWQLFAPQAIPVPVSAGGGTVTLAAQDAAHAHALDNAALSIGVTLTVADLAHGHALDASTLSTGTALAVADSLHAHALDNVTLSTTGATSLTVADSLHAHALDNVGLTSDAYLAVADMLHAHALDNVGLTSDAYLAVADMLHAHALDNVGLTSDAYLTVADSLHAHALDNVGLTSDAYLAAADLAHAHALDAVVLGTEVALAVADALHAHALDGVTLTLGGIDLVIAGVMHAHALDTLALTLDTYLAIADALHAHALDNADLSLDTYLVVADALHAHAIDNLTLSFPATGALSDAEFRQMYDWLYALSQKQLLTVGTFLALK